MASNKGSDVCHHHSCEIQQCLSDNNYQMDKCVNHLNEFIDCCRQWREKALSCEGFLWMFKEQSTDNSGDQNKSDDNKSSPGTNDKPKDKPIPGSDDKI